MDISPCLVDGKSHCVSFDSFVVTNFDALEKLLQYGVSSGLHYNASEHPLFIVVDPFFHYRTPDPEAEVWFEERGQTAGLLRSQDYETVLMGTSLNFGRLRSAKRCLAACTLARLLLFPALFIALGTLLGFRGVSLGGVMLTFATPVAVNSYTMALQMDADADLAGGIVLLTTGLSCLTLFLWIFSLKTLGLF